MYLPKQLPAQPAEIIKEKDEHDLEKEKEKKKEAAEKIKFRQ